MKKLLAVLLLATAAPAYANDIVTTLQAAFEANASSMITAGIEWKVGDQADYSVKMSAFPLGTMTQSITGFEGNGIWMKQDMNLAIQKQVVEVLLDKATGKILKYKQNGKEQTPPDQQIEVISQEYTEVTVPAGKFTAIHITAKTNQVPKIDLWLNPTDTVMDGMLKTVVPQQGMEMVIELTKFVHGN